MEQTYKTSFERTMNASIEQAWKAWTEPAEWSSWVFMKMSIDLRPGGFYENGLGEGGRYEEIIPMQYLRLTWEMKNYQPGSHLEIFFSNNGNRDTICRFVHHNLQTESDKKDSELGWNWAMDSLQAYLETGKGITWDEWESD